MPYDIASITTPEFLCRPDRYIAGATHLWSVPQTFGPAYLGPKPERPFNGVGTTWTNTCRRCGEVGYHV